MQALTYPRVVLHTATFAAWALAAAAVGYWVLQLTANSAQKNLPVVSAAYDSASIVSNPALLARLLGNSAVQPTVAVNTNSRFSLKGVMSGAQGKEAALIAIDDKPAKVFRVGSTVDEGLILQSTSKGKVTLAATTNGPVLMTLEMPVTSK